MEMKEWKLNIKLILILNLASIQFCLIQNLLLIIFIEKNLKLKFAFSATLPDINLLTYGNKKMTITY